MTSATDNASQVRRQQIIGMVTLLVMLIGGGALAWWKFYTPTPDEPLVDIGGRFGGGGGGGARMTFNPPAPPRDGVRKTGGANSNSYEVRAGEARMNASLDEKSGWRYGYRYQPVKYRNPTDSTYFTAKYRSGILQLSEDQKKQLNALPTYAASMIVAEVDQKKLQDQFQAYLSAADGDKPKREAELVQTLLEVAKRSFEPTLAETDSYINKIKAILTPEQIAKLTQPRAANTTTPPATSRPAR